MNEYLSTLVQPSGRSFIGYLFRQSDSFILNSLTASFEGTNLADTVGNARAPYRLNYTEVGPGSYSLAIDTTDFLDGEYFLLSREIANNVEYSDVSSSYFQVSQGTVSSNNLIIKVVTAPTRNLFAYIESIKEGILLRSDTYALGSLDLVSDPIDLRSKFRHGFTEEEPSNYTLTLDASLLPNGAYTAKTYELVGDIEIEAGEPYIFRVQDGKHLEGIDFGTIPINENTGGKDSLRYVTSSGRAVEGATVTLYLTNEYVQGNYSNPLGKTKTHTDGRWETPVIVNSGASYTAVFFKEGHFGPDSREVVV